MEPLECLLVWNKKFDKHLVVIGCLEGKSPWGRQQKANNKRREGRVKKVGCVVRFPEVVIKGGFGVTGHTYNLRKKGGTERGSPSMLEFKRGGRGISTGEKKGEKVVKVGCFFDKKNLHQKTLISGGARRMAAAVKYTVVGDVIGV